MGLVDLLHEWDQVLTLLINSLHCWWSDHLFLFFSKKWIWVPLYVLIAYYLFRRLGWKKALVAVLSVGLTIVACDQFANVLKYGVARLRPCYDSFMLENGLHMLEGRGSLFGFFSAHAADAFGLAASSIYAFRNDPQRPYRKYRWMILVWAVLVAVSRVFAGKHYFGDVLVGALVGTGFGLLFGWLARWVIRNYIEKPAA